MNGSEILVLRLASDMDSPELDKILDALNELFQGGFPTLKWSVLSNNMRKNNNDGTAEPFILTMFLCALQEKDDNTWTPFPVEDMLGYVPFFHNLKL